MKHLVIIICFALFNSCNKETAEEKFKRECPYTFKYGTSHHLKVPIEIVPNKQVYKIGDTIEVKINFRDSIIDISTEQIFQIKNFPFKPILSLYSFSNDTLVSKSFAPNQIIINQKYKPIYKNSVASSIIYENESYNFEAKIALTQKGRFILQVIDLYLLNGSGGNPEEWNNEANAITFNGKCPSLGYAICNMINGDSHLNNYEPELLYIDKKLSFDNWTFIEKKHFETPFGAGGFFWEFAGTYGFEVE